MRFSLAVTALKAYNLFSAVSIFSWAANNKT